MLFQGFHVGLLGGTLVCDKYLSLLIGEWSQQHLSHGVYESQPLGFWFDGLK